MGKGNVRWFDLPREVAYRRVTSKVRRRESICDKSKRDGKEGRRFAVAENFQTGTVERKDAWVSRTVERNGANSRLGEQEPAKNDAERKRTKEGCTRR